MWHIAASFVITFTSIWLRDEVGEASFLKLAIVLGIPALIGTVGIFFISNITDRIGHYREVIVCINIIGMIQYLMLTQITRPIQYLYIVSFSALVFPSYYTIIQSFATVICDPDKRGGVTTYLILNASIGWFVGSLTSGVAFRVIGMTSMFIISSILLLISGLLVLLSPKETIRLDPSSVGHLKNPSPNKKVTSLNILLRKPINFLILTIIIIDFGSGAFFTFSSIYLYEKIKFSSDLIGYSNATATLIATVALYKIAPLTDRIGRRPFYLTGLIVYPVLFTFLSIFQAKPIVFILWSLPIYIFLRPISLTMVSDLTTEHERSRGISLVTIASSVSIALGALMGGYLADKPTLGLEIWVIVPALLGWLAPLIGFFMVGETLDFHKQSARNNEPKRANRSESK
jgi:predicted MFS family arabinose efflux permease